MTTHRTATAIERNMERVAVRIKRLQAELVAATAERNGLLIEGREADPPVKHATAGAIFGIGYSAVIKAIEDTKAGRR